MSRDSEKHRPSLARPRRLTLEGHVHTDGDCIYVNGMILANVIGAALPEDDMPDGCKRDYGYLSISVERRP